MNKRTSGYSNIVLISQISISVMVPTFLCLAVGLYIDKQFSTWFAIPLLFLGLIAGGRNAYMLAMNAIKREESIKRKAEKEIFDAKLERAQKNRLRCMKPKKRD